MTEYSGSGDPLRTFALLWRKRDREAPASKTGLSLERIVEAAIAIADADGLSALSMRRVAEKLGVGAMTLYRYVPSKAELIDVMLDTAIGGPEPLDEVPGDWRAKLEFAARNEWAFFLAHPWAVQIAEARPVLGPNVLGGFEAILRVVSDIGLDEREMLGVVQLVHLYVRGAAREAVEQAEAARRTGVSDEQWWQERERFWEDFFSTNRFPLITRLWQTDAYGSPDETFEFGLQRLLDGVAVLVAARAADDGG